MRDDVLELIRSKPGVTKSEIASAMRFHLSSAHRATADLLRQRKIRSTGKGNRASPCRYYVQDAAEQEINEEPPVEVGATANTPAKLSLDSAIEALADALVARVTSSVEAKLNDSIIGMVEDHISRSIQRISEKMKPIEAPRNLKKVTVCGVLEAQAEILKKEFGEMLDLRFVYSNSGTSEWKGKTASSDKTLIMADFVGHSNIRLVESCGVTPVIVKGGMSAMRDKLMEVAVG